MASKSNSLFITGAGGFLGAALLRELLVSGHELKLLLRRPDAAVDLPANTQIIAGDLNKSESYENSLAGVETVIHMAALTGKVSSRDITETNIEGTRKLIDACKNAGVQNFLFVSSIAAGYPNKRFYPYATSKRTAEEILTTSGLNYAILRPTLVLGRDSPIWATLRKIAALPVIPMPGSGKCGVQPVDVTDVAKGIALLLKERRFKGETFDLGGKEAVSMRDFLGLVHLELTGKPARFAPAPLGPIRLALAGIEPFARPVLPATAGQLSLFANPSTARANWLMDRLSPGMASTEELVAELCQSGNEPPPSGAGTGSSAEACNLETDTEVLRQECIGFTRYLTSRKPTRQVLDHYVAGLQARGASCQPVNRFDRLTLWVAHKGSLGLWLSDSYCALFHRHGILRRRLILLLAVLEHAPNTHILYDRTPDLGPAIAILMISLRSALSISALTFGTVFFLPAQIVLSLAGRQGAP